jgi:hypothetical protein
LVVDEVDLQQQKYHGVTCNIGILHATEAAIDRFPLALVPSDANASSALEGMRRSVIILILMRSSRSKLVV